MEDLSENTVLVHQNLYFFEKKSVFPLLILENYAELGLLLEYI